MQTSLCFFVYEKHVMKMRVKFPYRFSPNENIYNSTAKLVYFLGKERKNIHFFLFQQFMDVFYFYNFSFKS